MFLRFCFAPLGDFEVHFLVGENSLCSPQLRRHKRACQDEYRQTPGEGQWVFGKTAELPYLYKHLVMMLCEGDTSIASAMPSLLCTTCYTDHVSPYACLL